MRKALVVIESAELGNVHWSIYRGLLKNDFPCYPLVLPRTGPASTDDNSQAVAVWSSRDDVGMVITVGPNDHLHAFAFDAAKHLGKPVISIQIDDDWGIRGGFIPHVDRYDEVLTSAQSCVPLYQEKGVRRCEYMPFAIDEDVFYPNPSIPKTVDVMFVGSLTGHRSQALLKLQSQGINVVLIGSCAGHQVPAWTIPYYVWKSEICINMSDQPNASPGMKIRPWEYTACGTYVLSEPWPGCLDLFSENEILYGDVEAWPTYIKTLLFHKEDIHEMARRGYIRTHSEHTWKQRFDSLVTRWKKLL